MNTQEYLKKAREALSVKTDYQLAKALDIRRERISDYLKLRRKPDEYACTRIAIAIGEDPAKVIAEIAVQWEKNDKKRKFWENFLLRAAKQGTFTLALVCTIFWWHAPVKDAMTMTSSSFMEKLVTYQPIMRIYV